jgi:hypothetical protein
MFLFPPEQFRIATPSGKYMHSLANKENKLATPLNNTFLFPPEQFQIATPSGKYIHILVNYQYKLAAPRNKLIKGWRVDKPSA